MIPVKDALDIILENLPSKKVVTKPLLESLGYTLAQNIYSDMDLPPFNKSAMDGYAVRSENIQKTPTELELIETIAAGEQSGKSVKSGKTIKIMTGAPVPAGADTVVMKEVTEEKGNRVRFLESVSEGMNICYQGEDLKKGTKVLSAGSVVRSQEIGLLAAVGKSSLNVYRKPSVAILTTGDELVEIDKKPRKAQIRNSNSYFLMAQMTQLGLCPDNLGIARDNPGQMREKIKQGLKRDILIMTGGVSVGDYDIVENILSELGVKILFDTVAIKPGKPFVFGIKTNTNKTQCLVFALPGNPVSAFVITEVFIRPAIAELTGNISLRRKPILAKLGRGKLKTSNREHYIPAHYEPSSGKVIPVDWHGSADIVGLTKSNSLIIVPPNSSPLSQDKSVRIIAL